MTTTTTTSRAQILHVVHSVEPGGTERMLCRLVRSLDGNGADHTICSLRDPRPFEGTLGDGLEIVSLSAQARDRFLYRRLAKLIRERHIDFVHARNWGTWTDCALACKSIRGVQLVLGFHGLQNGQAFTKFQRLRAKLLNLSALPVTTVSNAARDVLIDSLGFRKSNIQVISNGVDVNRFPPASKQSRSIARTQWSLSDSDCIVGSVANFFERVKGHDILIEAFAEVTRKQPNARLVLVGYGPLENEVRAQVTRMGIEDRVTFTGHIENVERVLPAFDVFVCSSHSEGMSNAVLEAMSTGLPCVVTDVSDHRRMFEAIDPDLVVPANNTKQLSRSIAQMLQEESRRVSVGRATRELIERTLTYDVCAETYRDMYEKLTRTNVTPERTRPIDAINAPVEFAVRE